MQWIRKCVIYWEKIYPVDSVIHLFNTLDLDGKTTDLKLHTRTLEVRP